MKILGFGYTLACLLMGVSVLIINHLPHTFGQLCFAVNMICAGICFRSAFGLIKEEEKKGEKK